MFFAPKLIYVLEFLQIMDFENNLHLLKYLPKPICYSCRKNTLEMLENKLLQDLNNIKVRNGGQSYTYVKFCKTFRIIILLDTSLHVFIDLIDRDDFDANFYYNVEIKSCLFGKEHAHAIDKMRMKRFVQIPINNIGESCVICKFDYNSTLFINISIINNE